MQILTDAGFQVRYQSSKKNWKKALQRNSDLVIVAGGDGTVAKVLKAAAGTDRVVAVLPVGTANNIARTLGILGDAREIAEGWKTATPQPFDVGVVASGKSDYAFVEAAGGGIFADTITVAEKEENEAHILGNETDRALLLLRRVVEHAKPSDWTINVDGTDASGSYLGVEVMNIRYSGASVQIAPKADPADGVLDVVLIEEGCRGDLLRLLDDRIGHHHVTLPAFRTLRGREIRIKAKGLQMRLDDEAVNGPKVDWEVSVKPGAVQILATTR
jgi:diacylglycerol kinase (ATP)